MPSRFGEQSQPDPIDVEKPYDIYVTRREGGGDLTVYRRAFFRGVKGLLKTARYEIYSDFIELEQSNGQSVFVRRHDVVKFCEPGTALTEERVTPPPPT